LLDRARLTVVAREERGMRTLVSRQPLPGGDDRRDELRPPFTIGKKLR
jgi:hypothetical protein